jgi:PAS domain-containing protein
VLTAERWKSAVTMGSIYEVEKRMRGVDGSYRWFQTRALPLRDASGSVVCWYGTVCVQTGSA